MLDSTPPESFPLSLLIVDDDSAVASVIARHAADLGFAPRVARSVSEARREIAEDRFAVAVVDWRLGDGSGTEVLAALAERSPETFRIMHSAHAAAEEEATAVAAHDSVDKGEPLSALRHALRRGERFAQGLARTAAPPSGLAAPWTAEVTGLSTRARLGDSLILVPEVGRVPGNLLRWAAGVGGDRFPSRIDLQVGAIPHGPEWFFGSLSSRGALDRPTGVTLLVAGLDLWADPLQCALADAIARQVIRRVGAERDIPTRIRLIASTTSRAAIEKLNPSLRATLGAPILLPPVAGGPDAGRQTDEAIRRSTDRRLGLSADSRGMIDAFGLTWNVAELEEALSYFPTGSHELSLGRLGMAVVESAGAAGDLPDLKAFRGRIDRFYAHSVLLAVGGNITLAAEKARVSRPTMYRLLDSTDSSDA